MHNRFKITIRAKTYRGLSDEDMKELLNNLQVGIRDFMWDQFAWTDLPLEELDVEVENVQLSTDR